MDEKEKASDVTTQQDGSVPPGDGGGGTANSPPVNGRPANVADLVMGVKLDHDWFAANRKGNRFYVVNLSTVIAAINLQPTKSSLYFQRANDLIEKNTSRRRSVF
ncbi:hypothetical protein [Bradyrhizobium quebecense]|uniref:Uncharacterized protein n=2 Tax=Bradyrhizobium quebecense TaxID=2748629 RepID=A0ABS3MW01_9BRAD|nr:hypothetical protein [Bradyrhizobium quebecense]UGY07434.1 hypothetical protein J4P68_0040380 [Bradyrhizobium quebecense]